MAKTLYLTIDDAPSDDCINKLDFLDAHGIKAVWFVEGRYLEERFDVAVDMLTRGHLLGNHAYSHLRFSVSAYDACQYEIDTTHALLERVHQEAQIAWEHKYFRFPYGDRGSGEHMKRLQAYLRQLGYRQPQWDDITYTYFRNDKLRTFVDWYWTYDSLDWSAYSDHPDHGIDSPDKVLARMDEHVPEGGRGLNYTDSADIVLLHDHVTPDNLFQQIIEKLLAKDVAFCLPLIE